MRVLLAPLHRAEYPRLIAANGVASEHAPDIMDVRRPRGDALYLAELADDEDPRDFEAREWAALVRLDEECPDHAPARPRRLNPRGISWHPPDRRGALKARSGAGIGSVERTPWRTTNSEGPGP